MKKERIIELLKPFNLLKHEYCVVASGSLVMHGILEEAGDLDLVVDENGFEKIRKLYPDIYQREDGWYTVTDEIEIVIGTVTKSFFEGYPVQDLDELLRFYQGRNEEKDKIRIDKIHKFFFEKQFK